jgi:hypothetical protein
MEARKLLDAAPYCPQTVEVLKRALDEAWSSIASTTSPDLVENTRLSLAHAIVAHAGLGSTDREGLKTVALDAIQKHPPRASVNGAEKPPNVGACHKNRKSALAAGAG